MAAPTLFGLQVTQLRSDTVLSSEHPLLLEQTLCPGPAPAKVSRVGSQLDAAHARDTAAPRGA